jgi:outer membrane receptor for ferrienterochelin and colicin
MNYYLYCLRRFARLILLLWIVFRIAPLAAQDRAARLDFQVRKATLDTFVRRLEDSTGFSFIYGEKVQLRQPVTLDVRQKTIEEILQYAFGQEAITFKISGTHILLGERPVSRKYTVSGYITDSISSETLIGANILESSCHAGTSTNPFGFYSLTLPEGEIGLFFSYLGYETKHFRFLLSRDTVMNICLQTNNQLAEIVVLSDKKETGIRATGMGTLDIPMTQIKNTPAILGEADILKTIQLMPGVQAGTEGFSGLYVRGGGPDQNLILLDGIPIYNADHMLGVFSIFTPEAMKKVTLFKGSFPARYGGRLSSIVDIRTNDGDMQNYHGTVSIGLLTSKLHLEGPILKDKTSFCLTGRRTYLDLVARPFLPEDKKFNYYFYDINAKVNHKFSDRSRLFLSFYKGKDHYDYKQDKEYDAYSNGSRMYFYNSRIDFNWGNTIAAGRWNYVFNSKLFSNTTVAYNHYQMSMADAYRKDIIETDKNGDPITDRNESYVYNSDYRSGIHDWSFHTDFDYMPVPDHHVKFGVSYLYHTFRPEVTTSRVKEAADGQTAQDTVYNDSSNSYLHGHEFSFYAEDNADIGDRLSLNAGIHLSLFSTQGKGYLSAQPRLSARYRFHDDFAAKASFTQMEQYVHLLSSSPISLPTDLWVPVTKNIRPMRSYQYAVGGYYTGVKGWEFSLESYYKDMHNVLEYQDGATFFGSSGGWQEKVEMGRGRSFGLEVLAQKTIGKTTGWLGYTIAKSDRQFKNGTVNNGERFPYKYDRRHNINFCVNHTFSKKTDIGITWIFNTGGTATVAEQRTGTASGDLIDYISHRNNYRLPVSHRLNLSINFHKKLRRGMQTWNISVYNAYNAMTPNLVYKEEEFIGYPVTGGDMVWERKTRLIKQTLLPCVPSVTYTFKF